MALFGGFGAVAERLTDLCPGDLKPSAGVGLRYQISREEAINLRLDLAFGEDTFGLYFNLFAAI